jgi:uncharacterized membrane protein AbrB (regulator of aidB expression)
MDMLASEWIAPLGNVGPHDFPIGADFLNVSIEYAATLDAPLKSFVCCFLRVVVGIFLGFAVIDYQRELVHSFLPSISDFTLLILLITSSMAFCASHTSRQQPQLPVAS